MPPRTVPKRNRAPPHGRAALVAAVPPGRTPPPPSARRAKYPRRHAACRPELFRSEIARPHTGGPRLSRPCPLVATCCDRALYAKYPRRPRCGASARTPARRAAPQRHAPGAARVLRAPTRRMPTRTVPKRNRATPHGRDALPRVRAALARPPPQLGERGRTRAGRLGKHPATAHGHRCRRGTSAVRSARRFTSNNQTATSSPATSILVREYVNKRSTSRTPAKACPSPRHAAATTSTAAEAVWTLNTTTLMYNE